jgi:nucleoid-associated protein YgaU
MMIHAVERWKVIPVLVFSLLLTGLACVGSLRAQIKEDEVDFEVMATVTIKDGDSLWNLAQKYYRDPFKWTIIKDMNKIPN